MYEILVLFLFPQKPGFSSLCINDNTLFKTHFPCIYLPLFLKHMKNKRILLQNISNIVANILKCMTIKT